MTYISSTTPNRLTHSAGASQAVPNTAFSSRTTKAFEQTSSAQTAGGVEPLLDASTYTRSPQQGNRGHLQMSSLQKIGSSARPLTQAPINNFDSLGSLKALAAHYQTSSGYSDAAAQTAQGMQLDPSIGERRFINDGNVNNAPRFKTGELFDLTLQTRDGDTISFTVSAERSSGKAGTTDFAFSVIGNLSDAEREAVDALAGRLGDVAKEYQHRGWADLAFLHAFDSDVIAGFSLGVQGENGHDLTIDYSLDSGVDVHTLTVSQNNYEYEVSADLIEQAGLILHENELYQQYRQTVIDTAQSYKAGEFLGGVSNNKAVQFFLDGLDAIIWPPANAVRSVNRTNAVDHNSRRLDIESRGDTKPPQAASTDSQKSAKGNSIESDFLSGLPDFSAAFSTPMHTPNASSVSETSQMSLRMDQVTDIHVNPANGEKTLEQRYRYESRVSQHFGIGGTSMAYANLADADEPGGQTYLYEVIKKSGMLARTMTVDRDNAIGAYSETKDSEHTETTKEVVNGIVEDTQVKDLTDPEDNYQFALQLHRSPEELHPADSRTFSYSDIQILEDMIRSKRIDLYS